MQEYLMRIETFTTDTFQMDYLCFGHGKTPLVIFPGLSVQSVMGFADAVANAYSPLTDDFTIYVFDRRRELPEQYSIYDMDEDSAEALRTLQPGPVCLFGAFQGGMIAISIALSHPQLVQRLILGSTAACITQRSQDLFESWIRLAKEGKAEELYLSFGQAIYPQTIFEQSRGLLIEAAKTVTEEELSRFVILAGAIIGFDVADELKKITCPVLVIGSKDDQVLGAEASYQIAKRFKDRTDCELFMYDGYGHAAYDTAPDYKERIHHFFISESTA